MCNCSYEVTEVSESKSEITGNDSVKINGNEDSGLQNMHAGGWPRVQAGEKQGTHNNLTHHRFHHSGEMLICNGHEWLRV